MEPVTAGRKSSPIIDAGKSVGGRTPCSNGNLKLLRKTNRRLPCEPHPESFIEPLSRSRPRSLLDERTITWIGLSYVDLLRNLPYFDQ